jgi:hypothetical protein
MHQLAKLLIRRGRAEVRWLQPGRTSAVGLGRVETLPQGIR